MKSQDYKNHTRIHPVYHYVLTLLVLITLVAAITNMVLAINEGTNILQAVILVLIMIIIVIVAALVRLYALKAQDRAIRAEESLRYYVLTGEVLDPTRLAPRSSLVRIATGRDAADTAFATTLQGEAELISSEIGAVVDGDLPDDDHEARVALR